MAQQPRRGNTTLLWGLLFGIILALLVVLDRLFVAGALRQAGLGAGLISLLLSRGVLYVVGLALFFLGGLLAARRSGAVESGVFAGLLAGALAGLTNLVVVVLADAAANRRLQRAATARHVLPTLHAAMGTSIFSAVVTLIVVTLVGAGVGALGGLVRRGSGRRGQPFQGGGSPGAFGYPPPPAPQAPAGGYAPPMSSMSPITPPDYSPVTPPTSGFNPPMPPVPGYLPSSDTPTIQTSQP
ncbi:MAG TPA: hypothetical protein VKT52_07465 [Ktedonobacterales bacterium]|nr:hypothetical protein [Ktedonobacterales bacterium]